MHQPNYASKELLKKFKEYQAGLSTVYVGSILKNSLTKDNNLYLDLIYMEHVTQGIKIKKVINDEFKKIIVRKLRGEKAIFHYHWFQFNSQKSIRPVIKTLLSLLIFRLIGGKIIWTVHNRYPHNSNFKSFNKLLRIIFEKLTFRNHVHCHCAIDEMSAILKARKKKFFVVSHPDYPVKVLTKEEAFENIIKKYSRVENMNHLAKKDIIFLMFGQIKSYKGILPVVDIFCKSNVNKNLKLIIAGRNKNSDYSNRIKEKVASSTNIIFIPEFIPHEDENLFYSLVHKVILNHQDTLTSGAAILALNYGKKIIAPNICCLSELNNEMVELFVTLNELEDLIMNSN